MRYCLFATYLMFATVAFGQDEAPDSTGSRLISDMRYNLELSGSAGTGDHAPLWIQSNRYGIESAEPTSAYMRAGIFRSTDADSLYKWRYGYGADIAVAANHASTLIIQQLYGEVRWKHGLLTIGAKERPMEFKNNRLSSGSQTLGINARPIPQVRIELPEYWTVPYTKGWLQVKAHLSYGIMTDKNWQHDFTHRQYRYTDNVLFHSKSAFFRIQNDDYDYPFSVEFGMEMASEFGGTSYIPERDGTVTVSKNSHNLKSFFNAFIPGGSDPYEKGTIYANEEGNQLGTYMLRLNYNKKKWRGSLYFEKFFEDQSGLFMVDYDGYGKGTEWKKKKRKKFLLYDFKDMMLGLEYERKNGTWFRSLVMEYLYTKYQSGPVYHDHNAGRSDHIGGIDEYYNHNIYPGWQHWGQAIGNPLYYSPIYNEDGQLRFKNNRFMAFHIGISGEPTQEISYRLLATWEEGLGTYRMPFHNKEHQLSFLAETTYKPTCRRLRGWDATLGVGLDLGDIIGDNLGINLRINKRGLLTGGKRRKR